MMVYLWKLAIVLLLFQIAGFISESMQGCGGQIVYPPNYLKNVYK